MNKDNFDKDKPINVMTLVGNGFDISVLNEIGNGVTTSYSTFYSFFKYKYGNIKNILIDQMEIARQEGKENWSDFESILSEKIENSENIEIEQLIMDFEQLQGAFSRFLNDVVNNDVIDKLSKATDVRINGETYPEKSLTGFMADLSEEQYERCRFHNRIDHHKKIQFDFIDFNFTSLLDIYLYLDKENFDPEPYITSDNNITFNTNPHNYKGHITVDNKHTFSTASCKMLPIDIYHPHGLQDVPKSLLFGTESGQVYNDKRKLFIKSYWARNEEKYKHMFNGVDLFIIYGCSLGNSDSWWWNKIYDRLVEEKDVELFIYYYGSIVTDEVINIFLAGCNKDIDSIAPEEYEKLKNRIYVINFGKDANKETVFLKIPECNDK